MGKFKKNKTSSQTLPKAETETVAATSPKIEGKSKKLMKKKDKSKAKFEEKMKKKKFKEKEEGGEDSSEEFTLGKLTV